ncbi:hypothetical protein SCP_0802900 [Sparassis crispa]|uniref:Alpha/beta hydrolase fold-3 domain-containing protein n=1 Tax=Sparassis crispa TaxID=139825 RepID=A0A401GU73_9APHY|nr:hypothetical protein SCP_0802900 [Sparassis crispa]GBE85768.1 hypothetical protein SCP_0802900 [Sparassis crispa]
MQVPPPLNPEAPEGEKYRAELLSLEQNKDAPTLTRIVGIPKDDRIFSLLLQPSHAGIPPLYLQVNDPDPLRDEGLLYAKLVEEAGVKTKVDIYPGVPHGFQYIAPQITAAVKSSKDFGEGIKWLLSLRSGASD